MQQLQYIDFGIIDDFKSIEDEVDYFPASSSSKNRGHGGSRRQNGGVVRYFERWTTSIFSGGHLDSIGLDKVAFATKAYSSSDVKHYFNCHAWVPEPYNYDADDDQILDIIIKFRMPSSKLSTIKDKNSEMKKKSRISNDQAVFDCG